MSPLAQRRGSKRSVHRVLEFLRGVASRAEAWIETYASGSEAVRTETSPLAQRRGSKRCRGLRIAMLIESPLAQRRGSKPDTSVAYAAATSRLSRRGVDRNAGFIDV